MKSFGGALHGTLLVMSAAATAVAQPRPVMLRLAVQAQLMGAPDVIALRLGYFEREGLRVDWRRFALGKDGRDAMIAGAIDVNHLAPTPFLIGLEKGVMATAVAVNSLFCGTSHIVVRKEADITSVAQLRGKRIGVPRGTITEFILLSKIMPAYGLKKGDYETPNIPDAKDRIPSVIAGAIDAAAVQDPFVAIGEHEGLVRSIESFCKYDPSPFLITVADPFLKENPEAVVAYLRGWLRAVKLLKEEPEKAAAIYLEDQKSLGRDAPVAVIDRALRRMRWEPEIDAGMERYLAEMARDMVAGIGEGRLKTAPDISKGLNRELLHRAMARR